MAVFVLDKRKKPLMPCSEKRARKLLEKGRAVVHKMKPFTIRLKDRYVEDSTLQPMRIKFDPGSKHTGVALLLEEEDKPKRVVFLAEINHKGHQIKEKLEARKGFRKKRRSKLRYRQARFNNRKRKEGWIAPSLQHRVDNIMSWTIKLCGLTNINHISMENVRFDMQKMSNPDITGNEYQQGTLQGYNVREYLLDKWGRKCAYCDKKDIPLEIEHIVPKSKGGSNRESNLTLACRGCNLKKGNMNIDDFLRNDPKRLDRILSQVKKPLKDAAAVNSTRNALYKGLTSLGFDVETGTGAQTKYNRIRLNIPKSHCLDAACVGDVDELVNWNIPVLSITSMGRGRYQRTLIDKNGFPKSYLMKNKSVNGFRTGDIVKAVITKGKYVGIYIGRVAVRLKGCFDINTIKGKISTSYKNCKLLQYNDGYDYK